MPLSTSLQSSYVQLPATALIGTVRRGGKNPDITTMKNANASGSIPIGNPVAYKPSGATSDLDATSLANSTDKPMGIVIHTDDYSVAFTDRSGTVFGELDATGVTVGSLMNVLREGWIYVNCITGCVPGDRLFASYAIGGPYTAIGQLGNATQASTTIDCTTKGEWRSTAAAAANAWLEVNFTSK